MTTNDFHEALQVRECLFGIHCCVDDEAMIKSLDTIMRGAPDYTFDQAIQAVQTEIADTNRIQEVCIAIIPDENARDEANGRSKAIALAEKKLSKKYPGKAFHFEGAEVVTDEEEL